MADFTESRNGQILESIINDEPYDAEPQSRIEELLIELKETIEQGGGGGGDIDVDTDISESSTNPVENRAIAAALDAKADKTDIADFVTDADVEADIAEAIGGITSFEYYLCGQGEYDPSTGEPTVANPDTSHIYLTPTTGDNLYMYAYINNDFVFLGTTEIDLDGYAKTAEVNAALALKADKTELSSYVTGTEMTTALSTKADKTELNDYVEESELATVAKTGAYSDLSGKPSLATVATSGAYSDLSGKPNLATVATSGSYNDLSNKPALKTVATSGSYDDLSNKPTIPAVPSNITLGKKGGTNTQLTINIIDSGTPAAGTPDTTITFVKG